MSITVRSSSLYLPILSSLPPLLSVEESPGHETGMGQHPIDGESRYLVRLPFLHNKLARVQPTAPLERLSDARRPQEGVPVLVRQQGLVCLILQDGPVLILAARGRHQAPHDQQELLNGEHLDGEQLAHLGLLGPARKEERETEKVSD